MIPKGIGKPQMDIMYIFLHRIVELKASQDATTRLLDSPTCN